VFGSAWRPVSNAIRPLAGCVAASEVPESVRTSREFWNHTIQTSSYAYETLPVPRQSDVEFLRDLPGYRVFDVHSSIPWILYTKKIPISTTGSCSLILARVQLL
jgi:hypothetical protein